MQETTRTYLAGTGLVAKGVVYCLLGVLAFMAAFEIGGKTVESADRQGVFNHMLNWPAGTALLAILVFGLLCYTVWRAIEAIDPSSQRGKDKWSKRLRYGFSAVTHGLIALSAIKLLMGEKSKGGDKNQQWAAEVLSKPMGAWLLAIGALVIAGTGIYQIYYGLSEKYSKHVQGLSHNQEGNLLRQAGKIGYVARGLVWLLIAFLLGRAALHSNAREAGDTGKAFDLLESATYGSLLLGAIGLGLAAYGVFNFVRARYVKAEYGGKR
jgi:hypothetical protein